MFLTILSSIILSSITLYAILAKPIETEVIEEIVPFVPECQAFC